MMLAIRAPERYRCVASFAGVSDLGLLLGSYDEDDADTLFGLLVDEALEDDMKYEQLADLSPLYRAEDLQSPMLLAHGVDDTRVDIEHSYRMKRRIIQLGNQFSGRLAGIGGPRSQLFRTGRCFGILSSARGFCGTPHVSGTCERQS